MTPEEIIARAICRNRGDCKCGETCEEDFDLLMDLSEAGEDAGSAMNALTAAGYEIRKVDPGMVYVPREPTPAMLVAAENEGFSAPNGLRYRAMISAATKGPVDPGAPKTNLARYADRMPPGGTIEEMHRRVTDLCGCQDRYKTCDCVSVFNKVLSDWWYEHNTSELGGE